MSLDKLVQLDAVQAHNQRGCCSNGRDDSAGDQLALVAVSSGNVVVLCPEVGTSDNEVHVHVGVVVLLEVDRVQLDGD